MTSAVVIGGGIAGLTAAKTLFELGVSDITVLESKEVFGGVIATRPLLLSDGTSFALDVGAESFALSSPATNQLIDDIGLSARLALPSSSQNVADAALSVPPGGDFGSSKSMTARIRTLKGDFQIPAGVLGVPADLDDPILADYLSEDELAAAKALDSAPWQFEPGASQSLSLGELVRARLGAPLLERLVTPVVAGVHASAPDDIESNAVSPSLVSAGAEAGSLIGAVVAIRARAQTPGAAVAGLVGGMNTLISELTQQLGDRGVKLLAGNQATHISRDGGRWRVQATGSTYDADLVVVAVNSKIASQLLTEVPQLAEPLAKIKTLDVAVVAISVESQQLNQAPLGSGVLVAPEVNETTSIRAKASTHINAKWPWVSAKLSDSEHLLRLSYGRGSDLPAVSTAQDQAALVAQAIDDAQQLYGVDDLELIDAQVVVWRDALVQARPGHSKIVAEIEAVEAVLGNLVAVGVGLGGNGMTGVIAKTKLKVTNLVMGYEKNKTKENK